MPNGVRFFAGHCFLMFLWRYKVSARPENDEFFEGPLGVISWAFCLQAQSGISRTTTRGNSAHIPLL